MPPTHRTTNWPSLYEALNRRGDVVFERPHDLSTAAMTGLVGMACNERARLAQATA
jgi:hypothetical protein